MLTLPLEMRRDPLETPRRELAGPVGSLVVASILAACGTMPAKELSPEQAVTERVKERWAAMVQGDFAKAYTFMSPSAREAISLEQFRDGVRPGFFKQAEVAKVECQPEVCDVELRVTYVYQGSSIVTPVRESWVRSGGGWWHVFKPS